MPNIKQVIVIRTDLRNMSGQKLRTGKLIAQGAHASVNALLNDMIISETNRTHTLTLSLDDDTYEWITGGLFKKITLGCDSLDELLSIYNTAKDILGLKVAIVKDKGLTELSEPTFTAVAIGPANGDLIDIITGHLKLL